MKLSQLLFSQGFGARRECEGLILAGHVTLAGRVEDDPFHEVEPEGLIFGVRGQAWPYRVKALVLLNKPAGHECSQKPKHHPSVISLLPIPLRVRGLQPVGRLDEDTTGLLLLTDDGALIHRLTSPKKHVPKVYEIETVDAVTDAQIDALRHGVILHDDPLPVRAAACDATGERRIRTMRPEHLACEHLALTRRPGAPRCALRSRRAWTKKSTRGNACGASSKTRTRMF